MKDVLDEIKRLREAYHWTEHDLAERAGLPQSTISTWYRKRQIPTILSLDKICQGFGITLSQFFAEDKESVPLSDDQHDLLQRFAALSPEQQKIFLDLFRNLTSV